MAQPSSSHHRERERERSSHHHHRSISSTTLLLILSLILAVLAVMLSLPSQQSGTTESNSSVWGYLSPRRSQALVAREHAVALREAEVARREADLLAGTPGGVASALSCPPVPSQTAFSPTSPQIYVEPPIQTIIKEVVKEVEALGPPNWWKDAGVRVEDLLDRESKISEREKDVGRREELIGRRESDASRRETWIMEQLIALGNEPAQTVEEEIIYDGTTKRKPKELPPIFPVTETKTIIQNFPPVTKIETYIETETVTVPPAASTRVAERPLPEEHIHTGPVLSNVRPTTAVEVVSEDRSLPTPEIVSEEIEEVFSGDGVRGRAERTVTVMQRPRQSRRPARWFGGRW